MTPLREEPTDLAHEHVTELLPWYATATLDPEESARVEAGLAACAVCREELARCRALLGAVRSRAEAGGPEDWVPSPDHLSGVLARIEAVERGAAGVRSPSLLDRLRGWLGETPRPVRWALAVQGAAALGLAAALVWRAPPPAYGTLSRTEPAVSADGALLHVVLAEDATEREIREVLLAVGGTLVAGPSPRGVYTVALPFASSERERVEAVVARLGAERAVRFVAVAPARSP